MTILLSSDLILKQTSYGDIHLGFTLLIQIWAASWQNQQNAYAPSEDSDQLGIRAQRVAKDPSFLHADSEDSDQTGRMPGWYESSLGAHATLVVLSWGGSYVYWK